MVIGLLKVRSIYMKKFFNLFVAASLIYYAMSLLGLMEFNKVVEFVIWVLFVYYFLYRCHRQKELKRFFLNQYLDWFAMIPIFLFPITDFTIFLRFIILTTLTFDYLLDYIEQILLRKPLVMVFIIYVIILFTGAIGFVRFEGLTLGESMWLAFISSTTVGYGDISAVTLYGDLVSVYVIVAGTIVFGAVLISVVMMLVEERRDAMIKEAERGQNKYEDIDYVKASFDKFKHGQLTLSQLEDIVYSEIQKDDVENM